MRLKRKARAQDEALALHNRIASPRHSASVQAISYRYCGILSAADSEMAELIVWRFVIFTTFAFLRGSMSAMAVRSGPPPAERQVTEPFARVAEPAQQI